MFKVDSTAFKLVFVVFSGFFLNGSLFAQDQLGQIETVTVDGLGKTEAMAKKEAFREAVRKVVGVLIDSTTQVKNDEVIKEEVLEYSGGFVQEYKILSKKNEGNNIRLKLECKVEKTRIQQKLAALKVTADKVDGGALADKEMSREELRKNASAFLSKALEDRKSAYKVVLPKKLEDLPKQEDGSVLFPVRVDLDNEYLKQWILKWRPIFEKMCSRKQTIICQLDLKEARVGARDGMVFVMGRLALAKPMQNRREEIRLFVGENWANNQQGCMIKYVAYDIPCDATKVKGLKYGKDRSGNMAIEQISFGTLRLEIQDKDGVFICGNQSTFLGNYKNHEHVTIAPHAEAPGVGQPGYRENGLGLGIVFDYDGALMLPPLPGDYVYDKYVIVPPGCFGTNFKITIPKDQLSLVDKVIGVIDWKDVATPENMFD